MGLVAELVRVASATIKAWKSAPGQAVVVTGVGAGGQALEAEVYAPAGILSRPPKDARGVFIPLGGGRKYGVVIAGHNYQVSISLADGETAIFSTDATGATLKAQVVLKADGSVQINGSSKKFVTDALSGLLSTFVTAVNAALAAKLDGGGTPGALSLDISSALTTTVKTGG